MLVTYYYNACNVLQLLATYCSYKHIFPCNVLLLIRIAYVYQYILKIARKNIFIHLVEYREDVLYRRPFCIGGHFVEELFVEGRLVEGRFVGRACCSEGRFVEGRFVLAPIFYQPILWISPDTMLNGFSILEL